MFLAAAGAISAPAAAHLVAGTSTLLALTRDADVVLRARVVDAERFVTLQDPPMREAVVVVDVLDPLKGAVEPGRLSFVQHGHGVPKYEAGEEVVVFLRGLDRSRELASTPLADAVRFVSTQEAGVKFPVDAATREAFANAVRTYTAVDALPSAEARLAGLRAVTLDLLASPQPTLAHSALGDVVRAPGVPLLQPGDVPRLEQVLRDPEADTGVRIGLLSELARRNLVEAGPRWAALLRETDGADRLAVVRAVAAHPGPEVTAALVALLSHDDPFVVAAAAASLGSPGNAAAVAPLAGLLESPEVRIRHAAIRGLGRVETAAARQALEEAAASHPDPSTRRRAAAEVQRLAQRAAIASEAGTESPKRARTGRTQAPERVD